MATITTDTYLDSSARAAGEAWTINSGATLTIRTDTRVHSGAPASNEGSLGSVTINEGLMVWDSRDVRVLPFDTGSGNVPAIGTMVTQGDVSGYLLGVWSDWASAQTAVGSAMPSAGFLKFREVTGGTFAAGALTGIGASAIDISVQGWIEIAMDAASAITVPRIGEHRVRGGMFHLGVTDGTVGQQFQIPSMGSHVQIGPGAFIETTPGSNEYEIWPGIYNWNHSDVGGPMGGTDIRQNFLKALPGGKLQMGEAWTLSGTYASPGVSGGTYNVTTIAGTYTWQDDTVLIRTTALHNCRADKQIGLQFTTGDAIGNDGIYECMVLSPYHLMFSLPGSGAGGDVSIRSTIRITTGFVFYAGIGDSIHCDFTSGAGVDGFYEITNCTTTWIDIHAPQISNITAGNVSFRNYITITTSAFHGLSIGQEVYLDFTSGAGVDGIYVLRAGVHNSNNFIVYYPHDAPLSGDVTLRRTIGNVAPSGCRVAIPSTILTECNTFARSLNIVPNATMANRPEWITTASGVVDFSNLYATSGFFNYTNAFSVVLLNSLVFDQLFLRNIASFFDIQNTATSGSDDARTGYFYSLYIHECTSDGIFRKCKFLQGRKATSYNNAIYATNSKNIEWDEVIAINLKYLDRTSFTIMMTSCSDFEINKLYSVNGTMRPSYCDNLHIKNFDYTDRINGKTNLLQSTMYGFYPNGRNRSVIIDGLSWGFGGLIPDVHAVSGPIYMDSLADSKIKNIVDLDMGSFVPNLYGAAYGFYSPGSADNIKISRCSFKRPRTGLLYTSASDNQIRFDNVSSDNYANVRTFGGFNIDMVSVRGSDQVTGYSAIYGKVFGSFFTGSHYGMLALSFNDPTNQTASQVIFVSGAPKFNGSGGLLLKTVGDKAIFKDTIFRLGYTAFEDITPTMTGGTIGHYTLQYRIDTGSGFSTWKNMTGANLSAETITPEIGFKMEWSIETVTANTSAITYLSISMLTTPDAQQELYSLDEITLTIPGLVVGSDVVIYDSTTQAVLDSVDSHGSTSWNYVYEIPITIDIGVFKAGYVPKYIRDFELSTTDMSLPDVAQVPDRNYA